MSKQLQILLLSGSLRRPSHTLTNLETFAGLLQERGASTSLWDLYDDSLPLHNPLYHRDPHSNPSEAVRRLAKLADDADAFVWGTPVYHNSFAGALTGLMRSKKESKTRLAKQLRDEYCCSACEQQW